MGSDHPDTAPSAPDRALAYVSQGKFVEGERLAREALAINERNQSDVWQRSRAKSLPGASLAGQKKYGKAQPLLLEGYQGMLALQDSKAMSDRYHLELARRWLVQLYQALGRPDKAAEWSRK